MHAVHEPSPRDHYFHLELDDALPGTQVHTIRACCRCGYVAKQLPNVAYVFDAMKEHLDG